MGTELRSRPPSRVLLVMINHHLGDFIIALPALAAICRSYPCPVDLLVDSRHAELSRIAAPFERIIPHDQTSRRGGSWAKRSKDFWQTVMQLAGRYDLVLDVGGGIHSSSLALFTFAGTRVGLSGRRRAWTYSHRLERGTIVHQADLYRPFLDFVRAESLSPFMLRPKEASEQRLRNELGRVFGRIPTNLSAIHPSAGHPHRCWPAGHFARIADHLVRERDWDVAIIGTASEQRLLQRVAEASGRANRVKPVIVELPELLALFWSARLLVSNESGPTHLASTTPVPIVTLFGPAQEERWRPLRNTAIRILRGQACLAACRDTECPVQYACVRTIEVKQVLDACAELLA